MAETVATITPETTEPVAPKTETPREDFNTMPLEDLKKIVEEKLERVPAPNKKALDDAVAAIEKQIADLRARFDQGGEEHDLRGIQTEEGDGSALESSIGREPGESGEQKGPSAAA